MLNESIPKRNTSRQMRGFFYGTLRTGFVNHDRYCRGAMEIKPGTVLGRLYDLGSFPALEVPDDIILAKGTADPTADVATQTMLPTQAVQRLHLQSATDARPDWDVIQGELMTFDDPEERLPRLDRLEGFGGGDLCLYHRVLVPILLMDRCVAAWTYVAGKELLRVCGRRIPVWPCGS